MTLLGYFFGFSGRIGRLRFWLFAANCVAAALLCWVNLTRLHQRAPWMLAPALLLLPLLAGLLTVPVKRLHDRGRSGWWLAFYALAPLVLFALAQDQWDRGADWLGSGLFGLLGLGIWAAAAIDMGVLRGTEGSNRYGDDPLAADNSWE